MVGILSDVGNLRKLNEDYVGYVEDESKRLYIVADGMGGHNAGEVASKLAVDTVISLINSVDEIFDSEDILIQSIKLANKKIYEMSKKEYELRGMGTTITACLIKDEDVIIANVGDSRCYIINRDRQILKITKDHSLVQQLVDDGSITEKEANCHPNKNIITRALGTRADVNIDIFKLSLKNILKGVLCTDGLTNDISSDTIYDIIMNNNSKDACRLLIESSKKIGGRDNISVIVFEGE